MKTLRPLRLALALVLVSASASAQVPTASQMRAISSLSSQQQAAAMAMLGGQVDHSGPGEGYGLPAAPKVPVVAPSARSKSASAPGGVGQANRVVRAGDVLAIRLRPAGGGALWIEQRYPIDRDGRLWLHGDTSLTVMGWRAGQVAEALSGSAFALGQSVQVRVLPRAGRLQGLGVRPFGYSVLSATGSLQQGVDANPPLMAVVPLGYEIGPGDVFLVQLFGKETGQYQLGVTRDGTLMLPKLGPLQVAGFTFDEARALITERVQGQSIGVEVAVSMGSLRTMQVYVLGDVVHPGARQVSALSTPLHALLAAGGAREQGSLRRVQVKRDGQTVVTLDLYQLLLSGRTDGYPRLAPEDVVFVPPVGALVAISGEVRRPAIYELLGGETVADGLALAGGVSSLADDAEVRLQRLAQAPGQQVIDLRAGQRNLVLQDGDLLRVFPHDTGQLRGVMLRGHVRAPGAYPWRPGLRLADVLPSAEALQRDADLAYVLISRGLAQAPFRQFVQASLNRAWATPDGPENPLLQEYDEIMLFSLGGDRVAQLASEVAWLSGRSVTGRVPDRTVEVHGEVHHPGRYPLSEGMHLTDLLVAAGDLTARAYGKWVELTRFQLSADGERRESERQVLDLEALLRHEADVNLLVQPGDQLMVRTVPEWQGEVVKLDGEVRFPGRYVIHAGESLSSVVARAGGVTDDAFLPGAVFVRDAVRVQEQGELDRLARNFEMELAEIAIRPASFGTREDHAQALVSGRELLRLLKESRASGRLTLALDRGADGTVRVVNQALTLVNGDVLTIPRRPDSVLVLGQVYHPTAHLFEGGKNARDYLALSGGMTRKANTKKVLLIHANGSVTATRVGALHRGGEVLVGDAIVVPQKVKTFSSLKLLTDVSQILYQLSLSAASARVIGVF